MNNVLIIGYGQIGKSIERLYENNMKYNVYHVDKDGVYSPSKPKDVDYIHVCIPYIKDFITVITAYILLFKRSNSPLTIIHTTVDIGVTKQLVNSCKNQQIVHSPIIGIHPHLTEGIKTFSKMVGGYNEAAINKACEHFIELGITPVVYNNAEETEAAKLLSTSYYGWNIKFMDMVKKLCDSYGLSFENVYESTNHNYNENYEKLGKSYVRRPILKPMGKGIGGHCITPNAVILHKRFGDDISKAILSCGYKNANTYTNETWLYCEYIGKGKSSYKIGEECGVSGTTIRNWLKKFDISTRDLSWTEEEIDLLKELSTEMTFKEISKSRILNRTYPQIRNFIYKNLDIKSIYNPADVSLNTRRKISCSLRNLQYDEFDDFCWKKLNRVHRKEYDVWRRSVLARDDYTCQITKRQGGKLNVHHIKSWKECPSSRFNTDNGITLSEEMHQKFHKRYGYTGFTDVDLYMFLEDIKLCREK